jgi:cell volume regulation protein A
VTEPEPWELGVRLRAEPDAVHRLRVAAGARADGSTIADVVDQIGEMWVSIVVRDKVLVTVSGDTRLQAGDEVVVLGDPDLHDQLVATFESRP